MLVFFLVGGAWGLFKRFELSPFISSISILNGATHTNCKHGGIQSSGFPGGKGWRHSVEACRGFVGVISPKTQQDGGLSSAGDGSHCPQEFTLER